MVGMVLVWYNNGFAYLNIMVNHGNKLQMFYKYIWLIMATIWFING